MKKLVFLTAFAALFFACQSDNRTNTTSTAAAHGSLTLLTEANPAWQHENLRLYPIVADAALMESQQEVQLYCS